MVSLSIYDGVDRRVIYRKRITTTVMRSVNSVRTIDVVMLKKIFSRCAAYYCHAQQAEVRRFTLYNTQQQGRYL